MISYEVAPNAGGEIRKAVIHRTQHAPEGKHFTVAGSPKRGQT